MPRLSPLTKNDIALLRLFRSDPVFAGTILIGDEYMPHQRFFYRDSWNKTFIMNARGRGTTKTFDLSRMAILEAILYSGWKVGIVGPSFRQAKFVFAEIERAINKSPFLQRCTMRNGGPSNLADQSIWKLRNGSMVFALPLGDGNKIRGARANSILMDEAAQISPEVIDLVIKPLAATAADPAAQVRLARLKRYEAEIREAGIDFDRLSRSNRLILSSSAYYQFNHFYEKYKQYLRYTAEFLEDGSPNPEYDPAYGLYVFDYRDLPEGFMAASVINDAMKTMGVIEFLMEWCAYFPADSDGFFNASLIQQCVNPQLSVRLAPIPARRYVMAVDPARTGDYFAISVFEEVEPGLWAMVYCFADKGLSTPVMRDIIGGIAARFNVAHICIDRGGGGLALVDLLCEPGDKEGFMPPLSNVVIPYGQFGLFDEENPGDPKNILDPVAQSTEVNKELYMGLKSGLETKRIQFAGKVDSFVTGGPLLEAAEQAQDHIMAAQRELRAIQMSANNNGTLHFDTPGNQPKDRAIVTCLGNYAAKRVTLQTTSEGGPLPGGSVSTGVFGQRR